MYVGTVRRQEVYGPLRTQSIVANCFQSLHRGGVCHANLPGHIMYTIDRTVPDNVFYVNIVSNKNLFIVVNIDYSNKPFALLAKVIKK